MGKKDIGGINPFQFGGGDDEEETSKAVGKHTDKSVSQPTAKQVEKHTDIQVHQPTAKLFRATFYIYPDDDDKLERLRLARRRRGEKTDKSELIRQAIALLPEE